MVLRAVNHPLRQKMLELIEKEKNIHVTKIYVKLRLEHTPTYISTKSVYDSRVYSNEKIFLRSRQNFANSSFEAV